MLERRLILLVVLAMTLAAAVRFCLRAASRASQAQHPRPEPDDLSRWEGEGGAIPSTYHDAELQLS